MILVCSKETNIAKIAFDVNHMFGEWVIDRQHKGTADDPNGIEWSMESMENADVSNMDFQGNVALLMEMVWGERFCDGSIMGLIKAGTVKRKLLQLKEIAEET